MRKKLPLLTIGIVLFCLFVFFSFLVHKEIFKQFDFNMTIRLQDHISRRFDNPFSLFSDIGSFEVTGVILLIFLALRKRWMGGGIAFFLFAFMHVFELYGKTFVKHLPPPHFMLRTLQLVNLPQFYVREQNSYPSGHAARATFVTLLVSLVVLNSKRIGLAQKCLIWGALLSYDIVMFVSRVYLGEHWTTDVVGGVLIGGSFSCIAGIFYVYDKKVLKPEAKGTKTKMKIRSPFVRE